MCRLVTLSSVMTGLQTCVTKSCFVGSVKDVEDVACFFIDRAIIVTITNNKKKTHFNPFGLIFTFTSFPGGGGC